MTDNEKIREIHESPFRADWDELPKEGKRYVLEGMEIGTDRRWVEGLIEEGKTMVYIDEATNHFNEYQRQLKSYKRKLRDQDAHEVSISRKGGMNAEMEDVAAQVDERDFTDEFTQAAQASHAVMLEICACGHDRYRHWDATDQCDLCRDCLSFTAAYRRGE